MAIIRHLEYLCLDCENKLTEVKYHNELVMLIYDRFTRHLEHFKQDGVVDQSKLAASKTISDLSQRFLRALQESEYYDKDTILAKLNDEVFLKPKIIALAKKRLYTESFNLCVGSLKDIDFAVSVAEKALKWSD